MKYRICAACGSNIDHGEQCECQQEHSGAEKTTPTISNRAAPLYAKGGQAKCNMTNAKPANSTKTP